MRTATEHLHQALIDAKLTAVIGVDPHQGTETRTVQRNGSRPRRYDRQGKLELPTPRLRAGSFFPSLRGRRRRSGQWSRHRTPRAAEAAPDHCSVMSLRQDCQDV